MPQTAPLTADRLVARYAADIAFVAEETPATTVDDFLDQLRTAHYRMTSYAGINLADDLDTAATYLNDAERSTNPAEKRVLLSKAADYMRDIPDAVAEYRDMV